MRGYAEEIRQMRILPLSWREFLETGAPGPDMPEEEVGIAEEILAQLPGWHRPRAVSPQGPFRCIFHAAYAYGIGMRDCLFFEFTPKIAEVGDFLRREDGAQVRIIGITDHGFVIDTGEIVPLGEVTKADIVPVGEV